ncbi:MAG: hypothetical protein GPOALKHO_000509 [Sodalis sp.]|nr:MAG: hypothetical protein GPOALKHO_000509 [Sodalis sp.]
MVLLTPQVLGRTVIRLCPVKGHTKERSRCRRICRVAITVHAVIRRGHNVEPELTHSQTTQPATRKQQK